MRDLKTFVAAMQIAGCPGLLLQQQDEEMQAHGTTPFSGNLPPNLRLELHAGGDLASFLQFIAGARLVVIPRFKHDIASTGISTYLMAMGWANASFSVRAGAEDLLKDEALLVEPENIQALAQAIRAMWDDDGRRQRIGAAGKLYADRCGGSQRLARDILESSLRCLDR